MAEIAGNLSPNNADFLPQFKAIGQGLRKRFFRKPNVAEAIEQYEELALELQRESQTEFAALCYMEASKCHEPLKNPIQQGNLLLKSGRLYLTTKENRKFFSDDKDFVFFLPNSLHASLPGSTQMAVQCMSQAARIFKRENLFGLSVLVNLEIAQALCKEGAHGEALKYYRSALDTVRSHFTYIDQIPIIELTITSKLEMTDYDSALKMINDTLVGIGNCNDEEISPEFRTIFTNRLEISRVCLLMLLGTNSVDVLGFIWPEERRNKSEKVPSPSDMLQAGLNLKSIPSPSKVGRGAGVGSVGNLKSDTEINRVQIELKSLVIAVQHGSIDELENVRNHLAPIMKQCHHNLFSMLIKTLS